MQVGVKLIVFLVLLNCLFTVSSRVPSTSPSTPPSTSPSTPPSTPPSTKSKTSVKEKSLFLIDSLMKIAGIKVYEYSMDRGEITVIQDQVLQLFCPGNFTEHELSWVYNGQVLSKRNFNWRRVLVRNSILLMAVHPELDAGFYECYRGPELVGQVELDIESSARALSHGVLYFMALSGGCGLVHLMFFFWRSGIRTPTQLILRLKE